MVVRLGIGIPQLRSLRRRCCVTELKPESTGYLDPLWWGCVISPVFTMLILLHLKPTGIYNAEGKNLKRYYDQCPEPRLGGSNGLRGDERELGRVLQVP